MPIHVAILREPDGIMYQWHVYCRRYNLDDSSGYLVNEHSIDTNVKHLSAVNVMEVLRKIFATTKEDSGPSENKVKIMRIAELRSRLPAYDELNDSEKVIQLSRVVADMRATFPEDAQCFTEQFEMAKTTFRTDNDTVSQTVKKLHNAQYTYMAVTTCLIKLYNKYYDAADFQEEIIEQQRRDAERRREDMKQEFLSRKPLKKVSSMEFDGGRQRKVKRTKTKRRSTTRRRSTRNKRRH